MSTAQRDDIGNLNGSRYQEWIDLGRLVMADETATGAECREIARSAVHEHDRRLRLRVGGSNDYEQRVMRRLPRRPEWVAEPKEDNEDRVIRTPEDTHVP